LSYLNQLAGLTGTVEDRVVRENRLRKVLEDGTTAQIVHPLPWITLGWCGDAGLTAYAAEDDRFALVFGSAHRAGGQADPAVSVDNPEALAVRLAEHGMPDGQPPRGVAGSFIAVTGNQAGGLVLFGDPAGNRAPFFTNDGKTLAFTNNPLTCARLQVKPEIDRGLEDFLLVYGFYPDGRTAYRNVFQLRSGRALHYSGIELKQLPLPLPAPVNPGSEIPASDDALYDQLYDTLLVCMEDQLASSPDAGVLLGGFDSALVASLLHRLGKRVHTYSFRYADAVYNQPHTDTLQDYLGCEHTWVDITPETIAEGLDDYAGRYVQPTNWLNYLIQTTHLCRKMRADGIDYAYSGDGCDAVFLGYPGTYKRTRAYSRLPALPAGLGKWLITMLARSVPDRFIGHPYRVMLGMLRAMLRPMPSRAFLTFRVMDETTVRALRGNDMPPQDEAIESVVARLAEPFADLSLQRIGYAAKSLISPNRAKLLSCSDVAGVRIHSPYLHPDLRSFAARIPDHLLREQGDSALSNPGKICLMRMAERQQLLPYEVIHQPKFAAIDSPIDEWLADELRPALDHALAGLPFTPDKKHLEALIGVTWSERLYKRYIGSTRVISDAVSLLATYGAICGALNRTGNTEH